MSEVMDWFVWRFWEWKNSWEDSYWSDSVKTAWW